VGDRTHFVFLPWKVGVSPSQNALRQLPVPHAWQFVKTLIRAFLSFFLRTPRQRPTGGRDD
jgi:hypothetical protein